MFEWYQAKRYALYLVIALALFLASFGKDWLLKGIELVVAKGSP